MAAVLDLGRARLLARARDVVRAQARLDESARTILSGQRPAGRAAVRLEDLLGALESALRELDRARARAHQHDKLTTAAALTCTAHRVWSHAKMGSDSERRAAEAFLAAVDALRAFL